MKRSLAIACLASLLVACGGGGGGGAPVTAPAPAPAPAAAPAPAPATAAAAAAADTTPPSITSFLPDTAARVAVTAEISATFSEALRAETATNANLRLTRSGTAVPGTVAYDAASRKVSFAPQQKLDLLASFTVTAGTGLQDLAGNGLAAEQSWTFRTQDGAWQAPQRLDSAIATSLHPDVALDAEGRAVAVWSNEGAGSQYAIRTASYTPAGGWGAAGNLSTPGSYSAFFPTVRFDAQGNGLAVWTQNGGTAPGTGASLWSARYVKGQGWQAPALVDNLLADVQQASLAMDAAGNAFAVWSKPVGPGLAGNTDIWAARFTPGGGSQAPARLGSAANIGTYDQAAQPQVVMDAAGNAYVLWIQTASDTPVWFARYQAGGGWQPAVSLGAPRLGDPFAPRLAVSASGQVVALWNSFVYAGGPYRFDLWSSVLASAGGSWSAPALLETDDAGDARNQVVVADSAGNFHVVWQQNASTYNANLHHRQYTPGTGWNAAAIISSAGATYDQNRSPSLVADRNGNLMVVWGVYGSGLGGAQEGTFARRYIAGEGWQAIVRIAQSGGSPALATSLAVTLDGSIAAAWMQPNDFRSDGPVWVNILK